MKYKPLSNLDIDNLVQSLGLSQYYSGCESKDIYQDPEDLYTDPEDLKTYFKIINLQDENDGHGSHWVCFIKMDSTIYYFDSFGVQPYQRLVDYCKSKNFLLLYNKKRYQQDNWSCGYWCMKTIHKIFQVNGSRS